MGVFAGPDITENGLVLAVDGANYKSFKGEATTNELLGIIWGSDGGGGGTLVTDNNLKYNGYPTYYYTPGTSLNSYLYGGNLDSGRTSTVWTFSCYVKREDGAPITSLDVYMYYPNSDGSAAGTIQDVGNGWYRISRTRTGASSYISLCGFTGFASGVKYYLSGAQLEKKSYTTTYVSTNTTRGTTVATGGGWADLSGTGNNGTLVNGVRESSANLGSLLFDGVDDYVELNTNNIISGTNPFTFEAFYKVTNDSVNAELFGNYGSGYTSNTIWISGRFGVYINTSVPYFQGYPLSLGTYHMAFTRTSGGVCTLYKNGIVDGTATSTTSISSSQNFRIGSDVNGIAEVFGGELYSLKVYNRVLTATEIQQNFNATRGRYGI